MFEWLKFLWKNFFKDADVDNPRSTSHREYDEENDHTIVMGSGSDIRISEELPAEAELVAWQVASKAQQEANHLDYGQEIHVTLHGDQRNVDSKELDASLNKLLTTEFTGLALKDQSRDGYVFTKIRPWKDVR